MSSLIDALGSVAALLAEADRPWALVGALAVSARTEPRFTRDIDIAIAVADDADAESVVRYFAQRGYAVFSAVEQDATKRLATARLTGPAGTAGTSLASGEAPVIVDLLFASSGIEPEIARAAEWLTIVPGVEMPVARSGHLFALKVLSRSDARPQDAADILALLHVLDGPERARAFDAVRLIAERGFARGKDLIGELVTLIG